ncbi:hypothetical protein [Psychrobacter aestuarii]|uniref:DUF3465 domain-containing protein n=1 Tax=Psychrobacter aestuarii TaxID=556327 RepID=A0ABP3F9H7_9GAMM|nr:hypothetical protein [Psychrobacter aestuarii]
MKTKKDISISLLISTLTISACQPINDAQTQSQPSNTDTAANTKTIVSTTTQDNNHPPVYVTALDVSSNEGNAAASEGVLNIQHGCLYVDDMLVIIASPYIRWTDAPFTITDGDRVAVRLGERVVVGGSSTTYQNILTFDTPWQQPPKTKCVAERAWLANSIEPA